MKQSRSVDRIDDILNVERDMKKVLALLLIGLSIASCTPTEQGAGIGAASGALIGAAATGNIRGAAVGGAIGGLTGAVIGSVAEQPGQCYYRDRYGRRYIDDCPRGGYRNDGY
jgi:uncharacterized membrane protein